MLDSVDFLCYNVSCVRENDRYARVAESADAHVWGACGNPVRVQVPSLAPNKEFTLLCELFIFCKNVGAWTREGFCVKKTIPWIVFSKKRLAGTEIRKNLGRQANSMRAICEQTVKSLLLDYQSSFSYWFISLTC